MSMTPKAIEAPMTQISPNAPATGNTLQALVNRREQDWPAPRRAHPL